MSPSPRLSRLRILNYDDQADRVRRLAAAGRLFQRAALAPLPFQLQPARCFINGQIRRVNLDTAANLTAASYVLHFDHWWNPSVEAQAEDRAHRIGQLKPVQVYSYMCADTVEERIGTILEGIAKCSAMSLKAFRCTSCIGWECPI